MDSGTLVKKGNDLADSEAKRGSTLPQPAASLDYIMACATLGPTNMLWPLLGMTAIHTRMSTEYLPTWSILTAAGHATGPEISASRWLNCMRTGHSPLLAAGR